MTICIFSNTIVICVFYTYTIQTWIEKPNLHKDVNENEQITFLLTGQAINMKSQCDRIGTNSKEKIWCLKTSTQINFAICFTF
jgi:hypothetical protein